MAHRGFFPTGISNLSIISAKRNTSEEKGEEKTPTKITQYALNGLISHLPVFTYSLLVAGQVTGWGSLLSHACTAPPLLHLGFAKRCWHGNSILPSTYLSPLSMACLPKLFFQLGEYKESASAAKGDLLCTCTVFGDLIVAKVCTEGYSPADGEGCV